MNAPLYQLGQRVEVCHDDGSWSPGTVHAIEAEYSYQVNLDPAPGIHGGLIDHARWQEHRGRAHAIRLPKKGEGA